MKSLYSADITIHKNEQQTEKTANASLHTFSVDYRKNKNRSQTSVWNLLFDRLIAQLYMINFNRKEKYKDIHKKTWYKLLRINPDQNWTRFVHLSPLSDLNIGNG
jgi:hypothetical protein